MNNVNIVLVALYRYLNIPIRIMHPVLENIPGVKPYTIFFKNCETNIFNYPTRKEEKIFIELISGLNPKIVGFSVLSPYVPIVRRLTGLIKDNNPSTLVIWGGVHPTISPESCIDDVDMLCVGEGEGAITELAEHLRDGKTCRSIRNLWVKDGGHIARNPMRPLIQDLDSLPFPAYGKDAYYFVNNNRLTRKDEASLEDVFSVQTSRGCPYACSFCVNSLLRPLFKDLGGYTRRRSVGNVIREIKENNKADHIFFLDEIFGTDARWLDEFEISYRSEVGLPFIVEYNPRAMGPAIIDKLADAGLDMVCIGIQTGSDYIRNRIFNRPGKNDEIVNLAEEITRRKVRIKYDLIINNPYDTERSLKDSIEFLLRLPKPLFFNLFSLQYFPGYPLTKKAVEDGHIPHEETSIDNLIEKTPSNWIFVPKLLPYNTTQILQNIIWLIVWNYSNDSMVKYAVFGNTLGSRACLIFLNFKAIILGKIVGMGGIASRNRPLSLLMKGVGRILKGDLKSVRVQIRKRMDTLAALKNEKR